MLNSKFKSNSEPTTMNRRRFIQVAGASMVVAGAGVFSMTSARAQAGAFALNVLHINDMHSRVESISGFDSTCPVDAEDAGECFGGFGRLATKLRQRRAELEGEGANFVTLDAGDQSQGSLFYITYNGKAEIELMNTIGFDAMALGNHEFDKGPDNLAELIELASFPVISGNTKVNGGALSGVLQEYTILEVGGEKIAVLSVLTPDTAELSSPGPDVTFEDEIAYLQDAIERVNAEGINKVLLLSHVGFARDQEIAAAVDGISAIIGGHSHTLLSNTVEGAPAYATMVENPSGRAVPIVQAYAYSKYLGDLKLEFDADGYVTAATGDTVILDASVEPDADIEARIAELAEPIERIKAAPVAEVAADIDGSRESCRAMECQMGNTVTDAMLARLAGQDYTIAITNGGGLRASIGAGTATMGDVLTVLPFQNTLATMKLSGADIVASLEQGVSQIEEGAGRFPQVSGLRFKLDPSVAPMEGRVSEVEVREGDAWVAIDPAKMYGVATNNFMRNGGDGYALFATNAVDAYDYGPGLEEVLAEYLSDNAPYTPVIDGRIIMAQ